MKFILTMQCDGAAFGDQPAEEVGNVLRRLMDTAQGYSHRNLDTANPGDRTKDNPFILFDANGVQVGTAYFDEVDELDDEEE